MRKFNAVFKEKQAISEQVIEERVLNQFKDVYSALLEQYETTEFYDLDENTQVAFLRELNEYWTEEEGISEKGEKFLKTKSSILTESSTALQKKSYLKNKATAVISETLRQADLKDKLYGVLDEMYKSVKAEEISDVLPADAISGTILESFGSALEALMTEMVYELTPEEKKTESINESAFTSAPSPDELYNYALSRYKSLKKENPGSDGIAESLWIEEMEEIEKQFPEIFPDNPDERPHEFDNLFSKILRKEKVNEQSLYEREFNTKQRKEMAQKGQAMSDGSFPIATVKDLKNAIKAIGRAKNPSAAKAHIKKRARALGKTDLLPEDWK